MSEHDVVIAGGGPTGLMLAGELALAGVDAVLVEPRATQALDGSRAGGLHARTLEVFDQRGIVDRFLEAGEAMQTNGFAYIPLDISDFPTRFPFGLALWQNEIERLLAGWVLDELGASIARGRAVVDLAHDDAGVEARLDDGSSIRARYLVGCDGGRSAVRKAAGIEFPGVDASTSFLIAEVDMDATPEIGVRPEGGGIGPIDRARGGGPYRVVLKEPRADHASEPTVDELRAALIAAYGTDYGMHAPTWISRFTDMARQAASYRRGRVLLAGDAAHVHSPHGGQGLNTGVQDAVNLGWKLAQVVRGATPESLLDTYHRERHPVGARVLQNTMAQVALTTNDERHLALRGIVAELLGTDEARRRTAAMLCGLDIAYDLGGGHPLVGRRMPDLDLRSAHGPTRVYELLHDARPVLLELAAAGVDPVIELPVIGSVPTPAAVLIRPDGHVAWAGDPGDPELRRARETWFGG